MHTALPTALPDDRQLQARQEKFDLDMRFRPLAQPAVALVGGLMEEVTHRAVQPAFVLGLIFLVLPHRQAQLTPLLRPGLAAPGGVPWFD